MHELYWVHNLDPVFLNLGPVSIHWYGITYLVGVLACWWLASYRILRYQLSWTSDHLADMIFFFVVGMVVGGRAGYVFFYNFEYFLENPLWLFYIHHGGMSFHGGLIGVIVAIVLFSRTRDKKALEVFDFIAPLVPIGILSVRVGNFIGGELWGRVSSVPWAVIFPKSGDVAPRHPSQLYEASLEGLVLFIIIWIYLMKPRPVRCASGLFLVGYGIFRFLIEFLRQPDDHLNFVAFGWMTRGQELSIPMILIGVGLLVWGYQRNEFEARGESSGQNKVKS